MRNTIREFIEVKNIKLLSIYDKLRFINLTYKKLQVKNYKFLSKHRITNSLEIIYDKLMIEHDVKGKYQYNYVYNIHLNYETEKELTDKSKLVAQIINETYYAMIELTKLINNKSNPETALYNESKTIFEDKLNIINDLYEEAEKVFQLKTFIL
jgi:hypothetical protein